MKIHMRMPKYNKKYIHYRADETPRDDLYITK